MLGKMIYSQGSKVHDWDFTLSAKREIVLGKGPLQAATPLETAHTSRFRMAFIAKALAWQFVTLLGRIAR